MKTLKEIEKARKSVIKQLNRSDLNPLQLSALIGISSALQWVCDFNSQEPGYDAIDRLFKGEDIAV